VHSIPWRSTREETLTEKKKIKEKGVDQLKEKGGEIDLGSPRINSSGRGSGTDMPIRIKGKGAEKRPSGGGRTSFRDKSLRRIGT